MPDDAGPRTSEVAATGSLIVEALAAEAGMQLGRRPVTLSSVSGPAFSSGYRETATSFFLFFLGGATGRLPIGHS